MTAHGSDVRAILAELDLRLRELEEELASVGAVPPPQPAEHGPPADAAPDPPAAPERQAPPAPEPAADPAAAALEAIRAAVRNPVEVVASAPEALVLRIDLTAGEGPEGGR